MKSAIRDAARQPAGPRSLAFIRMFRRADRGAALMEFALLLPTLLLMGVGVVEVGRAIYYTIEVNNGATAGVQYGVQTWVTALDTLGMQNASRSEASLSSMTSTATYGCTCDTGSGTSCTYPVPITTSCYTISCTGGQIVMCDQVTTQARITPLFAFPGLPTSYQANGHAVMRVHR